MEALQEIRMSRPSYLQMFPKHLYKHSPEISHVEELGFQFLISRYALMELTDSSVSPYILYQALLRREKSDSHK